MRGGGARGINERMSLQQYIVEHLAIFTENFNIKVEWNFKLNSVLQVCQLHVHVGKYTNARNHSSIF